MSAVINGTDGITFPTWTTATRPASPLAGQAGYNTTIGAMETYTGSTWSTSDLPASGVAGSILTSNGTAWVSQNTVATTTLSSTGATTFNALVTAGETTTISATAATGTINFDVLTQSVIYFTTNASANWTINIRGNSSTALNSVMAIGETRTVTHFVTQGATAYYNSAVQIDGTTTGVTTKWQGAAPVAGNPSGIDVYTYSIIKTASATFTVLAAQTPFK